MENQLDYYTETAEYRDRFDQGLPGPMTAYTAFRREVYQDGALSHKTKRLIALAAGLMTGCARCTIGQTRDAVKAGATQGGGPGGCIRSHRHGWYRCQRRVLAGGQRA